MKVYDFVQSEIDVSNPGFYNHPNFVAIERETPDIINEYNRYVVNNTYSDKYIEESDKKIQIITDTLYSELAKDGRQGACIDICQVISKILEAENIWCCIFVGSMTIRFAQETKIPDAYYWSVDSGKFEAAHTWIYAPPFKLIDVSISLQKHQNNELKYLPKYILERDVKDEVLTPTDIINPSILAPNVSIEAAFNRFLSDNPCVQTFMNDFPACKIEYSKCTVSYFPIRATASDGELNQFRCINFSGKNPIELYEQIIIPKLRGQ